MPDTCSDLVFGIWTIVLLSTWEIRPLRWVAQVKSHHMCHVLVEAFNCSCAPLQSAAAAEIFQVQKISSVCLREAGWRHKCPPVPRGHIMKMSLKYCTESLFWQMHWCEVTALENTGHIEADLLGVGRGLQETEPWPALELYLLDVKMVRPDSTWVQLLPRSEQAW